MKSEGILTDAQSARMAKKTAALITVYIVETEWAYLLPPPSRHHPPAPAPSQSFQNEAQNEEKINLHFGDTMYYM